MCFIRWLVYPPLQHVVNAPSGKEVIFLAVCVFASRITKEAVGWISTELSGRLRKEPGKNPLHDLDKGCDPTNLNVMVVLMAVWTLLSGILLVSMF